MRVDVATSEQSSLRELLRSQFTLRPGRLRAMMRITACCAMTAVVCMLFRIPVPAYAVYLVFMVSGAETATTLMTVIGATVAATAAVTLSIVLYLIDAGEPALRLPVMAAVTFLGIYLSRTITVGPIAFLIGFVLIITQTLLDDIPYLDALIQFVMWLWVVVVLPSALVALIDIAIGQNPARLVRERALHVLEEVEHGIRTGNRARLADCLESTTALVELRQRAEMVEPALRNQHALDMDLLETLDELVRSVTLLPSHFASDARAALISACAACRTALSSGTARQSAATILDLDIVAALDARARPVVLATANVLERLLAGMAQRAAGQRGNAVPARIKTLFVPDAFSNPDHVRFALKATLAAMLCYIVYSALDWPGIRTCVVTCFFVALGSVGETVHKLTLRLAGAMSGGLLGVLCIVFVLPHITDIGGLALLIASVAFLGAWISTSSEWLAYAGMQMAFAFFIGVLQGYGPTEELTVLRDRVLGILLGNVMMSVVFATVWPVSAVAQARLALAQAMTAVGELLQTPARGARLALSQTINRARRLLLMGSFEKMFFNDNAADRVLAQRLLTDLDTLTAAVMVVLNQPRAPSPPGEVWRIAVANWIRQNAHRDPAQFTPVAPPGLPPARTEDQADASQCAVHEAEMLLFDSTRRLYA